jgi:hypothetical protein
MIMSATSKIAISSHTEPSPHIDWSARLDAVVVPDGPERGIYLSPSAMEVVADVKPRILAEMLTGRRAVLEATVAAFRERDQREKHKRKVDRSLPFKHPTTPEMWGKVLMLCVAGVAERVLL